MHACITHPEAVTVCKLQGGNRGIWEPGPKINFDRYTSGVLSVCRQRLNASRAINPQFPGARATRGPRITVSKHVNYEAVDNEAGLSFYALHLCAYCFSPRIRYAGRVYWPHETWLDSISVSFVSRRSGRKRSARSRRLIAVHFSLSTADSVSIKLHLHNFRVVARSMQIEAVFIVPGQKKENF